MLGSDRPSRVSELAEGIRARRWQTSGVFAPFTRLGRALTSQQLVFSVLIGIAFAVVCSAIAIWTRNEPLIAPGRVMSDTRLVRERVEIIDFAATDLAREQARALTPRVFVGDTNILDEIAQSLLNLPRTVAGITSVDAVERDIREQFDLDDDVLASLQNEQVNGQPSEAWKARVGLLMDAIRLRPMVDGETWQKASQEGRSSDIRLNIGERSVLVPRGELINLDDQPRLYEIVNLLVRDAGFPTGVRRPVIARLTPKTGGFKPRPTYRYDAALSTLAQNQAADALGMVIKESPVGDVIYRRDDVLTPVQFDLYKAELDAYSRATPPWKDFLRGLGVVLLAGGVALALAGYGSLFVPRLKRSPTRMAAVAGLLAGLLALACLATVLNPALISVTAVLPTIAAAIIITIAYEQRVALAFGVLHGVLVCVSLNQGVSMLAVIVAGVATVVWSLREIRDRSSLIRCGILTAVVVGLVTFTVGLIERPLSAYSIRQLSIDSGTTAASAIILVGITLFALPLIERAFDVVTAMTLIELRDPKQPLLRELQIRAPGTYNHSLNVASIAEAAAESINADGLLAYVGALYHDCGKMNKPEYFVENQLGGPNKHEKLSPAMSLLLIVGHVKDGMELAREFGLPRPLHHFIESHHGTTLVEFFYHRARQQALKDSTRQHEDHADELDDTHVPEEFEYRYPGPRPQTREAAILMLADGIESATRTLAEPTPARIEALVRAMANKRLMDGQFEECDITLKDLNLIVDSISRTLTSIYHGRVVYPGVGSSAGRSEARAEKSA